MTNMTGTEKSAVAAELAAAFVLQYGLSQFLAGAVTRAEAREDREVGHEGRPLGLRWRARHGQTQARPARPGHSA